MHGGIIALVFDELLGCTALVNRVGAFTGTLTIRYGAITPLERPIELEGRITGQEGRKVFARGTMHCDGALTAEAEGIFIQAKHMMTDG